MSNTIEINELLENGFSLGLDQYPIFDEDYREELNAKIVNHYRFREICCSSPARFKYFLNVKMDEIMPLYNQRYNSAKITFNPLYTKDITQNATRHNTGSVTGNNTATIETDDTRNNTGTNITKDKTQDTPMGNVDITENNYLTGVHTITETPDNTETLHSSVNNTAETGSNSSMNDTMEDSISGFDGISASELIKQYRETFLNIDMEVINSLGELFFGLLE